jgi:3-oxoacyl-ACP reductase-like protein
MNRKLALLIVVLTVVALPLAAQETTPAAPAPTPIPAAAPVAAAPVAAAPVAAAPVAAAPVAAATPASTMPHAYLEKLAVVVDGKAKANGSVKLEFLPIGGEPKIVEVRILGKTGKKDIARDIAKELTLVAGGAYKVKQSGDEVRISKKDKKAPNVSVNVMALALPGVSVFVK